MDISILLTRVVAVVATSMAIRSLAGRQWWLTRVAAVVATPIIYSVNSGSFVKAPVSDSIDASL